MRFGVASNGAGSHGYGRADAGTKCRGFATWWVLWCILGRAMGLGRRGRVIDEQAAELCIIHAVDEIERCSLIHWDPKSSQEIRFRRTKMLTGPKSVLK